MTMKMPATYGSRFVYLRDAENGTGSGGGVAGGEDKQQQSQLTPEQQQEQDAKNFLDSLWDDDNVKDNGDARNGNSNNGNPDTGKKPDANTQLQEFLGKQDFGFKLTPEITDALQQGDASKLEGAIQNAIRSALGIALNGASQMVMSQKQSLIDAATKAASSSVSVGQATDMMFSEMPWAKEKSIRPIAESVLKRAMEKGKSAAEAVQLVKMHFGHMSSKSNPGGDNKGGKPPRNRPEGAQREDVDFLAMLSRTENEE